jgi:hypothetical protein
MAQVATVLHRRVKELGEQAPVLGAVGRVALGAVEPRQVGAEVGGRELLVVGVVAVRAELRPWRREQRSVLRGVGLVTALAVLGGGEMTAVAARHGHDLLVARGAELGTLGLQHVAVIAHVGVVTGEAAGAPAVTLQGRVGAGRGGFGKVAVTGGAKPLAPRPQAYAIAERRTVTRLAAALRERFVVLGTDQHPRVVRPVRVMTLGAVGDGGELFAMILLKIVEVVTVAAQLDQGCVEWPDLVGSVRIVADQTRLGHGIMRRVELHLHRGGLLVVAHETQLRLRVEQLDGGSFFGNRELMADRTVLRRRSVSPRSPAQELIVAIRAVGAFDAHQRGVLHSQCGLAERRERKDEWGEL